MDVIVFNAQRVSFSELKNEAPADYQYWKEHGWLEEGKKYFVDVLVNPLYHAIGRIVGWRVRRQVGKTVWRNGEEGNHYRFAVMRCGIIIECSSGLHTSTHISSSSILTRNDGSGFIAAPLTTLPVFRSKRDPWHGHTALSPGGFPPECAVFPPIFCIPYACTYCQ